VLEAVAVAIFTLTVAAIVLRVVDEAVAGLAGAVLAVALVRGYTPLEAFHYIDWNVIAILLGMWIITGYLVEAGFASAVVSWIAGRARGYRAFILALALAAGFVSMLVDNVLVILLFGSIAVEAAERARANPALAVMLVGLSANYMGTALLLGDLPPQLLHSIAGYEFLDFIWWRGRPGSFILLTLSFLATLGVMYAVFLRREPDAPLAGVERRDTVKRGPLALALAFFSATVAGMALRPLLGVPLGFIAVAGASLLALTAEAARRLGAGEYPSFEDVAGRVEWRALLFYASLFALVGSLEASGATERLAAALAPRLAAGGAWGFTAAYWLAAAPSTIVEHDAMLLSLLYVARDAAASAGFDPGPLYWAMAWGATLASNLTTAAAPALYVALLISERHGRRIGPGEFLRYSSVFVAAGLAATYLMALPFYS
jgi:Na+/H+ antiporter NhaD/arsenite permease-like protein